jgi:hypothetical protein
MEASMGRTLCLFLLWSVVHARRAPPVAEAEVGILRSPAPVPRPPHKAREKRRSNWGGRETIWQVSSSGSLNVCEVPMCAVASSVMTGVCLSRRTHEFMVL